MKESRQHRFSRIPVFLVVMLAFLITSIGMQGTAFAKGNPDLHTEWSAQGDFEQNARTTHQATTRSNIIYVTSDDPDQIGHIQLVPGATVGMIGGLSPSDVGLRLDTGVEAVWYSMSNSLWVTEEGEAVKMAIKTSTNGITWSAPMGYDGKPIDWTTGSGNYIGQAYTDSAYDYSNRAFLAGCPISRFVDIVVRLESNGITTPELYLAGVYYKRLLDYPNGSLLANLGPEGSYLIDNGQRRPFPSELAFVSNKYRWDHEILVMASQIQRYPEGPAVHIRPGTLIKGQGPTIYILDLIGDKEYKRPIGSAATFEALGLHWDDIWPNYEYDLSVYTTGPTITTSTKHPNGMLVKLNSNPTIYVLDNGKRRPFSSWASFASAGYLVSDIVTISSSEMSLYAIGQPVYMRAGTLAKTTGSTVYVIDSVNGIRYKRPIASAEAFNGYDYFWEDIYTVPQTELNQYITGKAIQ